MLQLIARTYSLARIFQVLQEWSILADIFVLTFSKVFLLHNHEENAPCFSFHLVKANLIYYIFVHHVVGQVEKNKRRDT